MSIRRRKSVAKKSRRKSKSTARGARTSRKTGRR